MARNSMSRQARTCCWAIRSVRRMNRTTSASVQSASRDCCTSMCRSGEANSDLMPMLCSMDRLHSINATLTSAMNWRLCSVCQMVGKRTLCTISRQISSVAARGSGTANWVLARRSSAFPGQTPARTGPERLRAVPEEKRRSVH